MAQNTWTYDAPTGTFKNHAMSESLRYAAVADGEFVQYAKAESGFGKRKGEAVTITRVKTLAEPTSGELTENQNIPIDTFALSTTSITVVEMGRGVEFTHFNDILSKFSLENPIQRTLKDQMALVLDTAAATAAKTVGVTAVPTTITGLMFRGAAAADIATSNLTYAHLGAIRDYLRQNLHTPFYGKGHYVGLFSTKAARGVKDDTRFQELTKYLRPGELVYNSEIGKAEQIRVTEVNHANALSNNKGDTNVLGEAIVFGEDFLTMAEAETPELRMAIPGNFGRFHAAAWYGVLKFGLPWGTSSTDGECRGIYVTSA